MAKYSVDSKTMMKELDDFWSYADLLKATENLITASSLKDMDKTVSNLEKGKVSKPIDLSDF